MTAELKQFVYTVECIAADDPRLTPYQREHVVYHARPWFVLINGAPAWQYRAASGAEHMANRMAAKDVTGQRRMRGIKAQQGRSNDEP